MGIEEVKKEILGNARKEAKRILQEAEKEGSLLMEAAEKQVAGHRDRINAEAQAAIQSYRTMAMAQANSLVKKNSLQLEKRLAAEVFEQCNSELDNLDSKQREQHVKKLVQKGKKLLGDTTIKVYCSSKDTKLVPKSEESDINGGVILENEEGDMRLDLSYSSLMNDVRQEQTKEISKILFE